MTTLSRIKRFKVVSVDKLTYPEWIGAEHSTFVTGKLGWRTATEGMMLLNKLAVGEMITDNDGWVWERVA